MPENDSNITRRELLRGRFIGGILGHIGAAATGDTWPSDDNAEKPPATKPVFNSLRYGQSFPVFRPPGAINEEAFLEGCTRCDACLEACPHDAIVHAPPRYRRAAGTPIIDAGPEGQPCWMCADFPCITACEPNVLQMALPKIMGVARIDVTTCLAHQNSFCTVCSEHCPIDGAIEVVNGKPRVIEDKCTGCGVCHHVCPAPANAVLLMPIAERPGSTSAAKGQPDE